MVVDARPDVATVKDGPRGGEWLARLPYALLGLLFAGLAWFVATQYWRHGRTYDEYMQDDYGKLTLNWYLSGGHDKSFLNMGDNIHMPEHGPAYEAFVALFQHWSGETWHTRSLVNGVVGVLGILVIALCGKEIAGSWGALTAAVGLTLYPRYLGAIFTNSKDVPFTVVMMLALWITLRLMRRWERPRRAEIGEYFLLGGLIGAAAAIRVNGLAFFALLGLVALGYLVIVFRRGGVRALGPEIVRFLGAGLVVASSCYLVMSLLWPYLMVYPGTGLVNSIKMMAAYDWDNSILFGGEMVRAKALPLSYVPTWLAIGSPLPVVVLTIASPLVALWLLSRRVRVPGQYLLIALYALVPLALIMIAHATLYNGIRQFLYVVPGFILLATGVLVGAVRALLASGKAAIAWGLVGLALVGQAEVVVATAKIYPFEYAYFSPVAGGFADARHDYEGDYWGQCASMAATWLNENYRSYHPDNPTFQDEVAWNTLTEPYLPGMQSVGDGQPTFLLTTSPAPDGYKEIHAVMVEGEPLCRVSLRQY
ncbi:MAG: hypothetical protein HOV67_08770 [Kribbellaceae bacterium]|nr:hypothetical protein [Kribbellaceae bacterium]